MATHCKSFCGLMCWLPNPVTHQEPYLSTVLGPSLKRTRFVRMQWNLSYSILSNFIMSFYSFIAPNLLCQRSAYIQRKHGMWWGLILCRLGHDRVVGVLLCSQGSREDRKYKMMRTPSGLQGRKPGDQWTCAEKFQFGLVHLDLLLLHSKVILKISYIKIITNIYEAITQSTS